MEDPAGSAGVLSFVCMSWGLSRYRSRGAGGQKGTPPPPVPRNRLAQEPPPGSAVEFSHHFVLPQYWVSQVKTGAH